jgi:hypothetical protein
LEAEVSIRTAVAIAIIILAWAAAVVLTRPTQPVCPEDAVAVGYGDYVGGVGWSEYHCEALDDLR